MVGNLHELGYHLNDSGRIGELTTLQQFFLFQVEDVRQDELDDEYDTGQRPNPGQGPNRRSDSPSTSEMKRDVHNKVKDKMSDR